MKSLLQLVGFIALWVASLILIADYSGGIPTELTETSLLVLLSLLPPLVLVGLAMVIVDLARDD